MGRLILVTVGTSLCEKFKAAGRTITVGATPHPNPLYDEEIDRECRELSEMDRARAEMKLSSEWGKALIAKVVCRMARLDRMRHRIAAPAEVASLWEMGASAADEDRAVLLYSDTPEGAFCALALQRYIVGFGLARSNAEDLRCIEGLTTLSATDFEQKGIPNLARALRDELRDASSEGVPAVINATGGYKGMTPFVTLGGLWSSVPVYYLYENAETNIKLPPLPVRLDLGAFRRHRHLLRLITADQPDDAGLCDILDESVRTLVESNGRGGYRYTVFGDMLEQLHRSAEDDPGGGGILMEARYLADQELRQDLLKRIARVERLLAVEYRIPQIVDHGRSHLGALLEFVDQICLPILRAQACLPDAQRRFTTAEIYVLLSYIWLHDIGHAGSTLRHYGYDRYITDPEEIRGLHHLMSHQRLLDEPELYGFPRDGLDRRDVIATTCIYHRYAMPLQAGDEAFEYKTKKSDPGRPCIRVPEPPKEVSFCWKGGELLIRVPFLAALTRLIDACDVQQGRAGHPFYQMWRHRTTELEDRMWSQRLADLRGLEGGPGQAGVSAVRAEVERWITAEQSFRRIQRVHFDKHNQVSSVAWGVNGRFEPQGPFRFRLEIHQTSADERKAARQPETLVRSVARESLKEAGNVIAKMRRGVCRYVPGERGWLVPFQSWETQCSELNMKWRDGEDEEGPLESQDEATYSRLLVRAVGADIIKEYAKARAILNSGGLYLGTIILIWEDGTRERIELE